jgi:hypothetical protein
MIEYILFVWFITGSGGIGVSNATFYSLDSCVTAGRAIELKNSINRVYWVCADSGRKIDK